MSTLRSIREAMKTALEAIDGLRAYDHVPGQPHFPAAVVGTPVVRYDATMSRGVDELEIPVIVLVANMVDRVGQDRMDALVWGAGAGSIKAALEQDRSLGGTVHTLRVTEAVPREVEVNATTFPGYELNVVVYASGES